MTKQDKRTLAILGGIAAVIIVLLMLRRGGAAAGNVGDAYNLPAVVGPQTGPAYDGGAPVQITIPGLDLQGPGLSMIGACCSDCMQTTSQFYTPQYATGGNTYVFNAANQGPNVFNYSSSSVAPQQSVNPFANWAAYN